MIPQMVSRSRVDATPFEPFLVNGAPFGEVHWLRTTSSSGGTLFTGLWRHPAGQFDYTFPADSAIPTTDRTEAQFRALFLQQLALKISRSFHAYESRDVFASDNHVL